MKFDIKTDNGGDKSYILPLKVYDYNQLDLQIEAPDTIVNESTFEIKSILKNNGYKPLSNLTIELKLLSDSGLTTVEPLTKSVDQINPETSVSLNWTMMANNVGTYTYVIKAEDETGLYSIENTKGIIVFEGIPASTFHNLTLKLKPYPCEKVGKEIYVKIYARSQKDRRKDDGVIAHSIIVPESMFSVTPQKVDLTINHNSQESFNITISNKGSTILNNISLTPSGAIAPWTTLSKTHIPSYL